MTERPDLLALKAKLQKIASNMRGDQGGIFIPDLDASAAALEWAHGEIARLEKAYADLAPIAIELRGQIESAEHRAAEAREKTLEEVAKMIEPYNHWWAEKIRALQNAAQPVDRSGSRLTEETTPAAAAPDGKE